MFWVDRGVGSVASRVEKAVSILWLRRATMGVFRGTEGPAVGSGDDDV
jgi:hypothetical protein